MSKHTPGPWKILDSHQYENHSGAAQLIENPDVGAVCLMIDTDDGEVCDANARLIAAAPELVEALGWIVEFCAEHPEWTAEQFPADSSEGEWLDAARAALAKAGVQ